MLQQKASKEIHLQVDPKNFICPKKLKAALTGNLSEMKLLLDGFEERAFYLKLKNAPQAEKLLSSIQNIRYLILKENLEEEKAKSNKRYFPQTYSSAIALFSLLDKEQIVAIPKGLREYKDLLPPSYLEAITLNCENTYAEQIYLEKPSLAFVAPYSLPRTIKKFEEQNIPICLLSSCYSLKDITKNLLEIGEKVHKKNKSLILASFFDLSLAILEEKFNSIKTSSPSIPFDKTLILTYYGHLSLSGQLSLNYQILKHLNIHKSLDELVKDYPMQWGVKVSKEQIKNVDPDFLFLISPDSLKLLNLFKKDPFFSNIKAVKKNTCLTLDERCSDNPSLLVAINLAHILNYFSQYSKDLSNVTV
jgi:ABC-type Fe3+-hydroxamate transport system substrate-binding protein